MGREFRRVIIVRSFRHPPPFSRQPAFPQYFAIPREWTWTFRMFSSLFRGGGGGGCLNGDRLWCVVCVCVCVCVC